MADDPFRTVRAGYDRMAGRYQSWSAGGAVRRRQLGTFLSRLRRGSRVVDLGCGAGGVAARLTAAGHTVIGVDASYVQLIMARRAAPSAALVQADMSRLHLAPGSVDAVASFYALGHLPADRHAPLFREVAAWLRPGGVFFTSAPLGAGDCTDPSWLGVPMFFGGIGEVATRQAIAAAGMRLEMAERVPEDEGGGRIVEFLWLLATRLA